MEGETQHTWPLLTALRSSFTQHAVGDSCALLPIDQLALYQFYQSCLTQYTEMWPSLPRCLTDPPPLAQTLLLPAWWLCSVCWLDHVKHATLSHPAALRLPGSPFMPTITHPLIACRGGAATFTWARLTAATVKSSLVQSATCLLSPPPPSCYCCLQGGCIIRAAFLDRIKQAYRRDEALPNLLVDPEFGQELTERDASWRRVVAMAVGNGVPVPGMTASLGYFDTYRRERLPANMVQVRDGVWLGLGAGGC